MFASWVTSIFVFWKVRYRNLVTTFYYLFRAVISFLPLTNTNLREFRGNSASLIDNIFVNNPDCVSVSGNIISDVSDHFSQFVYSDQQETELNPLREKCATSQISIGILLRRILIKFIGSRL